MKDQPSPAAPIASSIEVGRRTAATLLEFVQRLTAAYRQVGAHAEPAGEDAPPIGGILDSLTLAEAALRYWLFLWDGTRRPPQVAVLGPTQTGKSTVVNLLLGQAAAGVSPLAGYTVHPEGFAVGPSAADADWACNLFPGWRRGQPGQLPPADYEAYSLTSLPPPDGVLDETLFDRAPGLPACVVWDTPDFDSLAARRYSRAVLEVAALADVYLLVLSKEKYSDLSAWQMLKLLEPLERPLIICLNKLTPDAEQAVIRSLRERLAQHGPGWGEVPIVPLPYDAGLAGGGTDGWPKHAPPLRRAIRDGLLATTTDSRATASKRRAAGVHALFRRHWETWLAPVRAEHQALEQFRGLVESAAAKFLESYVRDYLEHPQRYDAFRRATVELLELLEIPQVGGLVSQARRVVTWPLRRLITVAQSWQASRRPLDGTVHSLGVEAGILMDALDALLTGLQRELIRRCSPGTAGSRVWRALEGRLDGEQARLRRVFETAIATHHEQMQKEVRTAAQRLYLELRKNPARLAALRTARAVLDVGYLLLAVKTAGLTLMDVVWAPATFAATSLLVEGVAGLELGHEARKLKAQQRVAVEEQFVRKVLVKELLDLSRDLTAPGLLAVTAAEVEAASAALANWGATA